MIDEGKHVRRLDPRTRSAVRPGPAGWPGDLGADRGRLRPGVLSVVAGLRLPVHAAQRPGADSDLAALAVHDLHPGRAGLLHRVRLAAAAGPQELLHAAAGQRQWPTGPPTAAVEP